MYSKFMVFLLGISLVGCVTRGQDFPSDTSWLKEEQTAKKDVVFQLGNPQAVGKSGGRETWTYGYYRYKLVGKSYYKELKLYWDPAEPRLDHYSFNSSFPGDVEKSAKITRK